MSYSLSAQLRALKKSNVVRASFHEDGRLKDVEFALSFPEPAPAQERKQLVSATGALAHANVPEPPQVQDAPVLDLLRDVVLAELGSVELDESDYPVAVVEDFSEPELNEEATA